jgi:Domain of unknown function (DUF5658)
VQPARNGRGAPGSKIFLTDGPHYDASSLPSGGRYLDSVWMKPTDHSGSHSTLDRRGRADRRRRVWWSVWYGNFNPRRRGPQRRLDDSGFHSLDWHSAHLLAVAIGILLLSVVDAFMTVVLLQGGAEEVNPVMALVVYRSVTVFATLKMALTSVGIILMVFLARYRFMRLMRVEWVLYGVLIAYACLICYEVRMLNGP